MSIVLFPAVLPAPHATDVYITVSSAAALAIQRGQRVYVSLQSLTDTPDGQKSSTIEEHAAKSNKEVQHWIQVYRFRLASSPDIHLHKILVDTGPHSSAHVGMRLSAA